MYPWCQYLNADTRHTWNRTQAPAHTPPTSPQHRGQPVNKRKWENINFSPPVAARQSPIDCYIDTKRWTKFSLLLSLLYMLNMYEVTCKMVVVLADILITERIPSPPLLLL